MCSHVSGFMAFRFAAAYALTAAHVAAFWCSGSLLPVTTVFVNMIFVASVARSLIVLTSRSIRGMVVVFANRSTACMRILIPSLLLRKAGCGIAGTSAPSAGWSSCAPGRVDAIVGIPCLSVSLRWFM